MLSLNWTTLPSKESGFQHFQPQKKKTKNHHICVTVSVSKVEPTAKFTRMITAIMKKVKAD